MITHAGARTRALYAWEQDDLEKRLTERLTVKQMQQYANEFWCYENWDSRERTPTLHYTREAVAYCWGRSDIFMTRRQAHRVVLIHELVHARGYGGIGSNAHTVGFVRTYLTLLNKHVGFDRDELFETAFLKGLI